MAIVEKNPRMNDLADRSQQPQQKGPRLNDQIRISPIRVIDQDGVMVGVIPTADAQRMAMEAGLDLVEVSPNERPPVCRVMDFGKFKYEQKKKQQAKQAKQHQTILKELRLRPKTGVHDIEVKVKQARDFLAQKDKVKVNVIFRGREHAHRERGDEILQQVLKLVEDVAKVEQAPRMEGRSMSMVLAPR